MKRLLVFIFAVSVCASFAQSKYEAIVNKTYTVKQMHRDLDVLEKKLIHFHPDPFHYISKDSLHLFVEQIKSQINEPLSDLKFRFYARQVVAKIGCGHTALIPSKAYLKSIDSVNRSVFPVDVWLVDTGKIFVRNYLLPDGKLKPGDEILSINGHPVEEMLEKTYSTLSSDGYNETYKKQNLQNDRFRYFYAAAYKYDTNYSVDILSRGGFLKSVSLKSLSSKNDTLHIRSRKKFTIIYKNTKAIFKIDTVNPHLAIFDINNFAGRKWRKLMKLSFKYIHKHPEITSLAVDLRDNGGGSISKGNCFMRYIVPKPFCTRFGRRINIIPFTGGLRINPGARITRFTFAFYPISWVRNHKWTHWFYHIPKHKYHFNGKTYVLTNGRSFSMSVVTAGNLKYKANATLIGEETGGTQSGSNAMLSGRVKLPNSKAQLIIPLYRIDHSINVPDTKRGLMPDYPCLYSIEDYLKGRDLEMEKVRELMKTK